jgi:hypothetical protein
MTNQKADIVTGVLMILAAASIFATVLVANIGLKSVGISMAIFIVLFSAILILIEGIIRLFNSL